jgi:Zn-dependent protease
MKCQKCQQEVFLPFKCPYCGDYFCSAHRLPENHDCPRIEEARIPKDETQTIAVPKQIPYEYSVSYVPVQTKRGKIHFSNKEITHLSVAMALVVGIGLSWGLMLGIYSETQGPLTLVLFATSLTASFFIHEIAHKITAQRTGLWAEFRLTLIGTLLTLISIMSTFFKIISPGAVMIAGAANKESIGKISIAGPITNIALSAIFFPIASAIPEYTFIFLLIAAFNAWIALFNLIPLGILDGFKIFTWNKKIWALAFVVSLVLTILSYELVFA